MKTVYVAIIWLATFQMIALTVASLGVFPSDSTLYSDFDINELEDNADSPLNILTYLFAPGDTTSIAGISVPSAGLVTIIGVIAGVGTIGAIFTGNYIIAVLAVVGVTFIPMFTKSFGFFQKIFLYWDTAALTYLGLTLGLGLFILVLLLIVEFPAQGDS